MSSTETTLVTISAVLALGLDVPADENLRFVVIFVLAAAMGIRNAAVRDLAVKDLTTTVLTMTLTGLFADSTPGGPPGTSAFRRVAAVVSMLAGAIAGGPPVLHVGLALPLFLSAACAAVSLVLVLRIERGDQTKPSATVRASGG